MPRAASLFLAAALLATALLNANAAAPAKAGLRDDIGERTKACLACHGNADQVRPNGYFPRIAGKPAGYLYNQLLNFRDGRRSNAAMGYLVAHLSDDYLLEMARHFAAQQPAYPAAAASVQASTLLDAGRKLALHGDPARRIPACVACHGDKLAGAGAAIPGLLGLPRDYINAQFGAWKSGSRKAAEPDCMQHISRQLTPDDIRALSSWLSAQPASGQVPAAHAAATLPIACGSAK